MTHALGLHDPTCKECAAKDARIEKLNAVIGEEASAAAAYKDEIDANENLLDYYRTRVDVLEAEIKRLQLAVVDFTDTATGFGIRSPLFFKYAKEIEQARKAINETPM